MWKSSCSHVGVIVTYEAIRKWCRKFGQRYANQLRRRRPRPGDKWHLDEVFLTIKGERHYLWRAVDQDGTVLDILVQSRRDKKAAKKFFRKLLKGLDLRAPRDHHRQTEKLRCRQAGTPAWCGTSPASRISITARRTRINPRASGSGACSGSSPPATPSDSSLPMVLGPHTFCPRRPRLSAPAYRQARSEPLRTPGGKSPASPPQHKRCERERAVSSGPMLRWTCNQLTMPPKGNQHAMYSARHPSSLFSPKSDGGSGPQRYRASCSGKSRGSQAQLSGDVIQIEEILGEAAPGITDIVEIIRADDMAPQPPPRLPA